MKGCTQLESGGVELYFYDELSAAERGAMAQHLGACFECRQGLDELKMIRAALSTRPVVVAPPDDDWSGFMARLERTVASEPRSAPPRRAAPVTFRAAPYLAIAATLVLAATSLVYVARSGWGRASNRASAPETASSSPVTTALPSAAEDRLNAASVEAAFAALSEQHFERSKLVVLGLAAKDARRTRREDWEYERALASSLLTDTRLYRLAAQERGFTRIADVMGDLELVLLQTSLGAQSGPEDLEQIQRLIDKRELVTKMELAASGI